MEYIEYIRQNWPDIASIVTVISFFITIVSLLGQRASNKKLEIAYFQFREIFLYTNRNKTALSESEDISIKEAINLLGGFEGMAAAGMHSIKPHSIGNGEQFVKPRNFFFFLLKVKKGLKELFGKDNKDG